MIPLALSEDCYVNKNSSSQATKIAPPCIPNLTDTYCQLALWGVMHLLRGGMPRIHTGCDASVSTPERRSVEVALAAEYRHIHFHNITLW